MKRLVDSWCRTDIELRFCLVCFLSFGAAIYFSSDNPRHKLAGVGIMALGLFMLCLMGMPAQEEENKKKLLKS